MKIAIIGHSGGGKSTLAEYLSKHYRIPCLHLDRLAFVPYSDWGLRKDENIQKDLKDFLDQHSNWVIDGLYSRYLFERRLAEADHIIFLNFSRWASLWRIIVKRYFTY